MIIAMVYCLVSVVEATGICNGNPDPYWGSLWMRSRLMCAMINRHSVSTVLEKRQSRCYAASGGFRNLIG